MNRCMFCLELIIEHPHGGECGLWYSFVTSYPQNKIAEINNFVIWLQPSMNSPVGAAITRYHLTPLYYTDAFEKQFYLR
jgi:hypothetical protein